MSDSPSPVPQATKPPSGRLRCGGCGARIANDQKTCTYCGTHSDTSSVPASAFCQKCGYALTGLKASDVCPECAHPVIESIRALGVASPVLDAMLNPEPEIPTTVPESALCRGCGYGLSGLQINDMCPECRRPVLDSIRGDLLKFCDASYLKSLHQGVVLVESGLIMYLLTGLLATAVSALIGIATGGGTDPGIYVAILSLLPIGFSLAGWLLLSVPDPGVSQADKGDKPRRVLRIAAIANMVASVVSSVLSAIFSTFPTNLLDIFSSGSAPIEQLVFGFVTVGAFVAFAIQYFAAMKYLQWLAQRIPSYELVSKMKRQTWVIGLFYFPGMFLKIGPLISLILFYNLLDRFRVDIKRIRLATADSSELWKDLFPARKIGIDRNDPPAHPPNAP